MPVLMNKGADPRQAAWLFYTDRATLDGLGALTVSERYDAGVLTVDAADLDAAKKASTEVPVYLAIATLVPKDFDLAQLSEATAQDQPEDADENPGTLPYDPVPAPEGTRVPVGLTTAAAARAFIQPREVDGEPWAAELRRPANARPAHRPPAPAQRATRLRHLACGRDGRAAHGPRQAG